ncbi:pentapeptide repeat-containing protein [Spirulina subsalsa FACHB-351]|uniref:Serine/threonine-protein kinase B n=1 Tax=Spirulina subsalsa FACHB-351 TaxID=234711 RepID=A0ABT3L0C7_9CYAN|nr:serine/threonine-protein kinase [Spirulina subsalsa]MCW6034949.1 pentapeptide repeat-containing protein [Spirulina subsalsa FACHB-351]
MSYCLNPTCPQPKNPDHVSVCQACGSKLILRDRYRVVKGLGQGGFGATFLAVDLQLPGNPLCVIKQLRPSTNDPNVFQMARELFEREATTLGKIGNHPQVPRLLDYFEDNKIFYLVQEYVKGNNLQQEIKRNGPVSEAGARQFLSEILPMLQYIHSQKVIHRDIKPANLIRREQDKKLVLIDFGAVKNQVTPQTPASASDQTALTSFAVGTPGFAPPEQMALRPVFASDIYALGVTCIYLLTGKSPKDLDYDPKTGEMMWQKNVDISENFANVLSKMLEVSVRHRYQTADEVLKALDMEPYLESLAEGLVAKPTGGSGNNLPNSGRDMYDSSPSGKPLSATERLAMAIRNKRNNPNVGSPLGRSGRGAFDTTSTLQTSGRPAKRKVQRLDEESLLNAYVKGRRDFAQQNLSNLNLPEANLAGGIFHQSKLKRTNLQGANLNHADFGRASLVSSNFRDANLGRAYLVGADLEGADLRGADLSYANFRGANLRGTNLCGANLANATITDEQLGVAKTSWTTILPNGKRGFWG